MLVLVSCNRHFISESSYRNRVKSDFQTREAIFTAAGITLDDLGPDCRTREAMEFLYAYMPLGDILNNTPEFYRECCEYTFKAVEEFPWGSTVPERELRHFVLPPRVNNENLDGCRPVFYQELYPRIKDLSMAEAVLEVNHWCHEKVSYKSSDSRTSAPLSTVRTAYGRCGEESTFLVAALRTVGIPARQVYTPRWAHTDDNHAWVEAWVDGEWHFLGACEPEAVLDLGWFNGPASRGMLMGTNVFGRYDGPEEKLEVTPLYTRINVVTNYAPEPRSLKVKVTGADGNPAVGAKVEYKIYNYGEFYSVATLDADSEGCSSITVGNGDLLVYASDADGNFGFAKSSASDDSALEITLSYTSDSQIPASFLDIVPPVEKASMPEVSDELRAENKVRLKQEDSVRKAYTATFRTAVQAGEFAAANGLDPESTTRVLLASCGNYAEIEKFLAYAAARGRGESALRMLRLVSSKDLRDTPADVLEDHLDNCADGADPAVMAPRIYTELLRPWRGALIEKVDSSVAALVCNDPADFVKWCSENLTIYEEISEDYTPVNPVRVWESRICDKVSRQLFFVAVCRSFGVPAWKDYVSGAVRYVFEGREYDVDFDAAEQVEPAVGTLKLTYKTAEGVADPQYYTHFSISAFDGRSFRLLEFNEGDGFDAFKDGVKLAPGLYVLCTGKRISGGEVLSNISFFTISKDEITEAELVISDESEKITVLGKFDSSAALSAEPSGEAVSVASVAGKGYYSLVLLDAISEPSMHALKDIEVVCGQMEAWGRPCLLVFATKADYDRFDASQYKLPSTVRYAVDSEGAVRAALAAEMKLDQTAALPYVIVADGAGRVLFFSKGYTIGLGDQILTVASKL